MNRVRLAVIGLHFGKKHASNIASPNVDADLAAVCDLVPVYSDLAEELGTAFYTDYRKMLDNEKPDGVVIAVPPHARTDIVMDSMDNGIHTFVEKPIANEVETADSIIAAAERNHVKLLVGHQHRFDPGVVLAKRMIESETAGPLVGFHVFGAYHKIKDYFRDEWRNKRSTGGGPLISNGIHDIDRIRFICGDIEAVTALMSNTYRGFEVEDTMAVSIKCKNGAVGTYYISDCSYPLTEFTDYYYFGNEAACFNCSSMYPTEGQHTFKQVTMDDAHPGYYLREQRHQTTIIPAHNNHVLEMDHFARVIRGAEKPRCPGEDAKKTLEALIAIIESTESRRTITLQC